MVNSRHIEFIVKTQIVVRIAAILGLAGVSLGAFGAHSLEELLIKNNRIDVWETAVLYQFVHALSLLALAGAGNHYCTRWVVLSWTVGTVIFSGSLYALALTNVGILGAVTPVGGGLFLVGWARLIFLSFSGNDPDSSAQPGS